VPNLFRRLRLYPAKVRALGHLEATLAELIDWFQEKSDSLGESESAQEKADVISDIITDLDAAKDSVSTAMATLEELK
jgi:hypothetical protein